MTKKRGYGKDTGLDTSSAVASADELVFSLFEVGAIVLIATFLWLILLMGGVH